MARAWYSYINGNPLLIASWRIINGKPACVNGGEVCAIYAYYPGENPPTNPVRISSNLQEYLSSLRATLVAEPQNGDKKFVYGRLTP